MPRISKSQQEEVRQAIIREARSLFFSQGFAKTSTKAISQKVGIAEGTLFNYFDDKHELFLASLASEFAIDHQKILAADYGSGTAPIVIHQALCEMYRPFLSLAKPLIMDVTLALIAITQKDARRIEKLLQIDVEAFGTLRALVEDLRKSGRLVAEVDAEELSENIVSVFLFEVLMYAYDPERSLAGFVSRLERKIESVCRGLLGEEI